MAKSNGTFDLMKAMQEMEARLSTQIGGVATSVSSALTEIDAVKETHTTFRGELLGPKGRVTTIEEDMSKRDTRQWLHTFVIIPILAALHAIARQLGWQV